MLRSGELPAGSKLVRNGWVISELYKLRKLNIWLPFMSATGHSVINMGTRLDVASGNSYIKEVDGELEIQIVDNTEDPTGTGVDTYGFSMAMLMHGLSFEVRNPKRWANIIRGRGELTAEQAYKDMIPQMVRVYNRAIVPQIIADLLQSNMGTIGIWNDPTGSMNRIEVSDLGWLTLTRLMDVAKTGVGFADVDKQIVPITPIGGDSENPDVEEMYVIFGDNDALRAFKSSSEFAALAQVDIRGHNNMQISDSAGGKLGSFKFVEIPSYSGKHGIGLGENGTFTFKDESKITRAGFRQYDTVSGVWSGQAGFSRANDRISRVVICGANCISFDKGNIPYTEVEYENYKQGSTSAMFADVGGKKLVWEATTQDNAGAKFADCDNYLTVDLLVAGV